MNADVRQKMKVTLISVVSIFVIWALVGSNLFYFAPKFDSQEIAGISLPDESELIFRKQDSPYKIYKWHIPRKEFSRITTLQDVSKSPFHELAWSDYEFFEFSDGPGRLLARGDIASDSQSIHYRTPYHDVEMIRSHSESTIIIISIYNN